jgi:catechol 2,3-dioxygenase-like lactoylglutathione lyase family enzyme
MFDHVSIGVADIARSKKFYDAALKPLGFSRLSDGETSLGYGEKAVQLWLGAVGNRCAWCARPRRSGRHNGGRVARGRVRIRRGRAWR